MAKRKKKINGGKPQGAPTNFVHLHGLELNKASTHRDRRKEFKRGKEKHKTDLKSRSSFLYRDIIIFISELSHYLALTLQGEITCPTQTIRAAKKNI
jgi:hypothetical protein